jgi:trehalose-phosphatase
MIQGAAGRCPQAGLGGHSRAWGMIDMPSNSPAFTVARRAVDAVLFDLDGVVTHTAQLHAAAWKELFDGYLQQRAAREHASVQPFDANTDYRRYVDGKPRNQGIESFLSSRGIELPYGDPTDGPEQETIYGLGNKKNGIFLARLKAQGAEVYHSTVELIHFLKARGIKVGIVSSSKNCAVVLEVTGLSHFFDTRVDGWDSERFKLKGKPAPDIFLKAAEQLGVSPERTAIVEDAIAGVEAGRNGRFAVVIGVARQGNQAALHRHGADVVVEDLSQVGVAEENAAAPKNAMDLPSALERADGLTKRLQNKHLVMFLDYDGTLTPIVERPDQALLSSDMRQTISDLARCCPVAIVSGRDHADVQRLVQLDGIFYAGSHGFEIAGPHGMHIEYEQGADFLPILDHAERELDQKLRHVEGALVERKKFSIAVHVRGVARDDEGTVEAIVNDVLARHSGLRKGHGKKVFELQPRLDWHKGKAVLWLLQALELDGPGVLPLYIGDDLTDEDAFRTLADRGIGIIVEEGSRPTAASYVLKHPGEVHAFLRQLISWLNG